MSLHYLMPMHTNFAAFDSLIMVKKNTGYELILFRITINMSHPVVMDPHGVTQLYNMLPTGFKTTRSKLKIHLVFLVPADVEEDFKAQTLHKSGRRYPDDQLEPWMKEMKQWVVSVPGEELFDVGQAPEGAHPKTKARWA